MGASEFRDSFATFVGPDRYRQFVRALNREGRWRGRLLFWQEELLARFAASAPYPNVGFERVEVWLRVCELHGAELAADPEAMSQRCRGAVTDFTRAGAERFPNTDCGPVVMGHRFDNFRRGLWYCPACRVAEADWLARHAEPRAAADRRPIGDS
ncbi:hypothetical protein [Urbifossiella limnaea]|uniref:Uncharacterized protein n=1 Tax=Urbifossiella limnaea TaxID=2528023 RepID=A0A517XQS5_9BACT|nr:hypothetical protein [Urbifossiella limnaea]QDU19868.1 hypothetical protein ETAA1_18060 [Urbifossiella limnaea]